MDGRSCIQFCLYLESVYWLWTIPSEADFFIYLTLILHLLHRQSVLNSTEKHGIIILENEIKNIASIRHVVDIYQEPNWS